ncbi:MAG: hypothetical protein Q8L55_04720 [Phycisphaerales bacterium]|nr:hypothetical protein [Phycisphaerales bacterium]
MASPDKARLLTQMLDRLRAKVKPAAITGAHTSDEATQASDAADAAGPDIYHADTMLREFVRSFLIWECTTARADAALKKIASAVVDVNEFRVCLPVEMASIIGPTYPKVEDRVLGLRAALTQIFKVENRLRLGHLPAMSKKSASAYLANLTHAPAFVTDRVALLCCNIHTVPVDSRIAAVLEKAKVIDKGTSPADASSAVGRLVKAGDARDAYALLQGAADLLPVTPTRVPKAAPAKTPTAKPRAQRGGPRKAK